MAGILGPVLVNYVNEQQIRAGVPRAAAYDQTMMLLAGLLALGLFCNSLVRPVVTKEAHSADMADDNAVSRAAVVAAPALPTESDAAETVPQAGGIILLGAFWLLVAAPMAWGLWATVRQAAILFR